MSSTPAKRQRVDGEKATPATSDFESFAPDGDIVFVVNGDTRVRVRSAVMKGASPVFAAMLGPNFMEGQALAKASADVIAAPVEISLPEERSSNSFGWICRALHRQSDTKLWKPTCLMIADIWSIIEKYGMKESMQLSVSFWSNNNINCQESYDTGLWLLAIICFHNQDSASFRSVTRKLLKYSTEPFLNCASAVEARFEKIVSSGRLSYKLAAKLQVVRDNAQNDVVKFVYSELPDIIESNGCFIHADKYLEYLPSILDRKEHRIYFLDTAAPLKQIREPLLALDDWVSLHGTEHGGSCPKCAEAQPVLRKKISDFLARKTEGLCLACFEDGDNTCPEHKK